MKDALRLAGYARRYWYLLALSVLLMALMGAMTAFRVILIKPVLGTRASPLRRRANPSRSLRSCTTGFTWNRSSRRRFTTSSPLQPSRFTVVQFLVRGICDYLGDYLTSFVGFSAVTDLSPQ